MNFILLRRCCFCFKKVPPFDINAVRVFGQYLFCDTRCEEGFLNREWAIYLRKLKLETRQMFRRAS